MKKQIRRLSPHQNGKVFGVLMAASSLIFVIPFFLLVLFGVDFTDANGNAVGFPPFLVFIFPIMYFILGYIGGGFSCLVYNWVCKYIGGLEYETAESA